NVNVMALPRRVRLGCCLGAMLLLTCPPLVAQPVSDAQEELLPLPASSLEGPVFTPELRQQLDAFRWQEGRSAQRHQGLDDLRYRLQSAL
ncbi:hypothetical protein V0R37_22190, partial [Pollutimonas sp. H1-120]|uniref:hypothetical protein n=1 Tax=Pollutimonas sp. H1-120 TaxID=3148824 RepID=UPI003B517525